MTLEMTLSGLRRKAIARMLLYGILTFFLFRSRRFGVFAIIPLIKCVQWYLKSREITRFPAFLSALNGREAVYSAQLSQALLVSKGQLGRKINRLKQLGLVPVASVYEKNGTFLLINLDTHPLGLWLMGEKPAAFYRAAPPPPAEPIPHEPDCFPMKCFSCGAESLVPEGRTIKCPYCGKGLRWQGQ